MSLWPPSFAIANAVLPSLARNVTSAPPREQHIDDPHVPVRRGRHQRRLPVFVLRVDVRARRIIACTSSSPFTAAANISGVRAFYQNQLLTTVVVVFLYLLIDKTVPLLRQSTVVGLSRLRAWSVLPRAEGYGLAMPSPDVLALLALRAIEEEVGRLSGPRRAGRAEKSKIRQRGDGVQEMED